MTGGVWLDFGGGHVDVFLMVVFAFVGLMALLYSLARVRESAGRMVEYYVFLVLLMASGVGVVFARNLLLMLACWELATVSLWRLVGFSRRDSDVTAANWALFVNFAATALMLVGFVMILSGHDTLSLAGLSGVHLSSPAAWLLFAGILAKSATLPLYIWLPRAYRAAPAPVCALLSGVAENVGVVAFFRLFVQTVQSPVGFLPAAAAIAVLSSLVAGGVALSARTARGLLAYSTVSQLGFVFLGMAVGGYYGTLGALLYAAGHAVAKSGLFFAVGAVQDAAGTDEFDGLGGWAHRSPALAAAVAVLMFSIVGLPPMVGFIAKFGVIIGAVKSNLLLSLGAIGAALSTLLYMSRFYAKVFLGNERAGAGHVSGFVVVLVVTMALVTVAAGLGWFLPLRYLGPEVDALTGGL